MKSFRIFPTDVPDSDRDECFVIMPFSQPFNEIYEDHVSPALSQLPIQPVRADEVFSVRPIMQDVWKGICRAKFVVAELTGRNANVFYELGIAHAIGKPAVLLAQSEADIPFDVRSLRCILYEYTPRGCKQLEQSLIKTAQQLLVDLVSVTVGVSGSYSNPPSGLQSFVHALGTELLVSGIKTITGGGKGLAFDLQEGMMSVVKDKSFDANTVKLTTFKPIGHTDVPPPPLGHVYYTGRDWRECREAWIGEIDSLIVIGGGPKTSAELEHAINVGVPVVVVRGTEGAADMADGNLRISESYGDRMYFVDLPTIDALNEVEAASIWAREVVKIVRDMRARDV